MVGGDNMAKESAYFIARNSDGQHGRKELKQKLDQLSGVTSVSVNPKNHLVAVDYESSRVSYDQIENCLNHLGYEIAADASLINTR
jgi:copper chaperone CopZ